MVGIKKTSSIKNKFFDNKPTTWIEEKIHLDADLEMDIEEEKECMDVDMKFDEEIISVQEMDVDEQTIQESPESAPVNDEKEILEDAKSKRADWRKTILKELEVCDLLDLWNP